MKVDPKISVGVYVTGAELDPEQVHSVVELPNPTLKKKGERRTTSSGREFVVKAGAYSSVQTVEMGDLLNHLRRLSDILPSPARLRSVGGVEDVFLDVLVLAEPDDDSTPGSASALLPADLWPVLNRIGLPVNITLAVVRS